MRTLRIRIISSKEDIGSIEDGEKLVHFAFRPSMKDVIELITRVPSVSLIEIPESYNTTLSKGMHDLFEMKGITLVVGDVWGHRTDLYEYADLPVDNVRSLSKEGKSTRDVSIATGLKESLVSYILR